MSWLPPLPNRPAATLAADQDRIESLAGASAEQWSFAGEAS